MTYTISFARNNNLNVNSVKGITEIIKKTFTNLRTVTKHCYVRKCDT